MAINSDVRTVRPSKRQPTKPPTRQGGSKVKSTIHLSVDASQRLDIHATMLGLDRSSLVEKLISEGCRRWVVSDRSKAEDLPAGQGSGEVEPSQEGAS